jgi:hypothetical protein
VKVMGQYTHIGPATYGKRNGPLLALRGMKRFYGMSRPSVAHEEKKGCTK